MSHQTASVVKTEVKSPKSIDDNGATKNSVIDSITVNGSFPGTLCISNIFAPHDNLKRLLGTLVQFAKDISPETGDNVRNLIIGLLVSQYCISFFHKIIKILSQRNSICRLILHNYSHLFLKILTLSL